MNSRRKLRLLLTCCLGYYMQETIACFKASQLFDVTIIGLDMNPMHYNTNDIDVFYQVPRSDDPAYFDVVFDIAKKEQVDIVMPLHSKELIPFCQRKAMFEELGMLLAVPPLAGLEIANDKIRSHEYMAANGFPTPLTLVTASSDEAIAFIQSHPEVLFVTKLPDSCGARGFHLVGAPGAVSRSGADSALVLHPGQLKQIMDEKTEMLIQSYLPGMEYTVDLVLREGKLVAGYTKECTLMEHGVIRQAVIVDRPDVQGLCVRFAESLGLSGNIGFDLKSDAAGNPVIIDVNPRITATIGLGRFGGLNLPDIGLQCLLGYEVDAPQSARPGICIARQIADFYFDPQGNRMLAP